MIFTSAPARCNSHHIYDQTQGPDTKRHLATYVVRLSQCQGTDTRIHHPIQTIAKSNSKGARAITKNKRVIHIWCTYTLDRPRYIPRSPNQLLPTQTVGTIAGRYDQCTTHSYTYSLTICKHTCMINSKRYGKDQV